MKILILLIGFISITYAQQKDKDIIGFWKPENLNQIVEIYEKDNAFFGKVALIIIEGDSIAPKKTIHILSEFKFDGEETWEDGTIYIHEKKKEIDGELCLDDEGNLEVTGYISFFSKSFTWFKQDSKKIKRTILEKQ